MCCKARKEWVRDISQFLRHTLNLLASFGGNAMTAVQRHRYCSLRNAELCGDVIQCNAHKIRLNPRCQIRAAAQAAFGPSAIHGARNARGLFEISVTPGDRYSRRWDDSFGLARRARACRKRTRKYGDAAASPAEYRLTIRRHLAVSVHRDFPCPDRNVARRGLAAGPADPDLGRDLRAAHDLHRAVL